MDGARRNTGKIREEGMLGKETNKERKRKAQEIVTLEIERDNKWIFANNPSK